MTLVSVNDSRCGSDVVCVRAGDAAIALALSGVGVSRTDTIWVGREPKATTYGSYRIEALDVQPFPRTTVVNPSRVVTLRISNAR